MWIPDALHSTDFVIPRHVSRIEIVATKFAATMDVLIHVLRINPHQSVRILKFYLFIYEIS